MQCLSKGTGLSLFAECPLASSLSSQMAGFPFILWLTFHFMYIPHFLYPFIKLEFKFASLFFVTSFKWNHEICIILCLAFLDSFVQCFVFLIYIL